MWFVSFEQMGSLKFALLSDTEDVDEADDEDEDDEEEEDDKGVLENAVEFGDIQRSIFWLFEAADWNKDCGDKMGDIEDEPLIDVDHARFCAVATLCDDLEEKLCCCCCCWLWLWLVKGEFNFGWFTEEPDSFVWMDVVADAVFEEEDGDDELHAFCWLLKAAALATAAAAYISNGCTIWPKPLRNGSIWFFSFFLHFARRFLNQT